MAMLNNQRVYIHYLPRVYQQMWLCVNIGYQQKPVVYHNAPNQNCHLGGIAHFQTHSYLLGQS